jgi:hypothetical protein
MSHATDLAATGAGRLVFGEDGLDKDTNIIAVHRPDAQATLRHPRRKSRRSPLPNPSAAA